MAQWRGPPRPFDPHGYRGWPLRPESKPVRPLPRARTSRSARTCSFDERDLVDLAKRRRPVEDALDRRLAEKPHAFFAGALLDFRGRPLLENHLANVIREVEQLADGGAALVARSSAFDAADAFVERLRVLERRVEAGFVEQRPRHLHRPAALGADGTNEPLRQHAVERRHE